MMDFGSFLAHSEAVFKAFIPGEGYSFGKTHIFNLGEDEKIEEGIRDIWDDLKEDMKDGVPMPFPDISCVSQVPVKSKLGQPPMWIFDRTLLVPITNEDRAALSNIDLPSDVSDDIRAAAKRGPLQKFCIIRVEEPRPTIVSWIAFFYGVSNGNLMMTGMPTEFMAYTHGPTAADPKFGDWCIEESRPVLKQITAISHPGNFVVHVTPKLTPKEVGRVSRGKTFPTQKMPHFVVVDHDVLVGMSRANGGNGTHASPVPHHRRGHWMRLAERCREAKAAGKDRVWVRPTYVGDTEFSDLRNDYKVLMDFGKKEAAAIL